MTEKSRICEQSKNKNGGGVNLNAITAVIGRQISES